MRNNFFIFTTHKENFDIFLERCIYGSDAKRSDQRGIGNVKKGDLALIWVYEKRNLYGVFEIQDRVFYDETDVGCRVRERKPKWYYRFPFRLWDNYLRFIPDDRKTKLMSFISNEMTTIADTSDFNQRYINPLLYSEGTKTLRFFLENSEMCDPKSFCPNFGRVRMVKPPIDFREKIGSGKPIAEYVVELYLLQYPNKLEELLGSGISELYNQIFVYANRFMDILIAHRDDCGELCKATILEIKSKSNPQDIQGGVEQLLHYMYWVADKLKFQKDLVFGLLLSPSIERPNLDVFRNEVTKTSKIYGCDPEKIRWMSYARSAEDLEFEVIV